MTDHRRPAPPRWYVKPAHWAFACRERDTKAWIEDRPRVHWLLARACGWFLLLLAGYWYLTTHLTGGSWVTLLASVTVAVAIGRSATATLARSVAYRAGWLEGRVALRTSLAEAQRRGMTTEEWLASTYEQDLWTL